MRPRHRVPVPRRRGHALGFCLLVLLIGAALAFIGDLIGIVTQNPEATAPVMLVPQVTLGLASVGLQPVERFPEWIQSFVRNQPLSQFVYALQALAGDTTPAAPEVTWSVIGPAVIWVAGTLVVVISLHASGFQEAALMSVAAQDEKTDKSHRPQRVCRCATRAAASLHFRSAPATAAFRAGELTSAARSAHLGAHRANTSSVEPRSCNGGPVAGHACRCSWWH